MSFIDILKNKDKLRDDMLRVTFFITLYENFKKTWKDEILYFYANEFNFEGGEIKPLFTMVIGQNPDGTIKTAVDKVAKSEFENKVYRTIRKANGDWDNEASMYNLLLTHEIITKNQYNTLIEIRSIRNKLFHELDKYLNDSFPNNLSNLTKELIAIREYSSKQWFLNVELPTSCDAKFDDNGDLIIPDVVISSSDFSFQMLYGTLFEDSR